MDAAGEELAEERVVIELEVGIEGDDDMAAGEEREERGEREERLLRVRERVPPGQRDQRVEHRPRCQ